MRTLKAILRDRRAAQTMRRAKVIFMHVGKTGGTTISRSLTRLREAGAAPPIIKAKHGRSLSMLLATGTKAKLGVIVRPPEDRFVSAFNSRMRRGRPAHDASWSLGDAIVFSYFKTPNELAEALECGDARLEAAAELAMRTLNHLARGYAFYLGSPRKVMRNADRLAHVWHLRDMDTRFRALLLELGTPPDQIDAALRIEHVAPQPAKPLSEQGLANLKKAWAKEYAIYDALCVLADRKPSDI